MVETYDICFNCGWQNTGVTKSDDQIKAVMDINGEDINKAKSSNDEMIKENEALKSQLSERDKDFAKLKKNVKDNEELTQ